MEITRPGSAGTLESCDAAVTVEPRAAGAEPALEVLIEGGDGRYEKKIRAAALAALAELGVKAARVSIRDRSALDCTVRARVLAACLRATAASEASQGPWEVGTC